MPAHTQSLIDAYRAREAMRAQGKVIDPLRCPHDESPLQQSERYLRTIGGCWEEAPGTAGELPPRADAHQEALLRAAFDARSDEVSACVTQAHLVWWDAIGPFSEEIALDAEGRITSLRTLEEPQAHPEVACCVRRALRMARPPAPGRPVSLRYVANGAHAEAHDSASAQSATRTEASGGAPSQVVTRAEASNSAPSQAAIRATIDAHVPEVRQCYESALTGGVTFQARVAIEFVIGPDGRAPLARVASGTPGVPNVGCCIADKVRQWQFPKPGDAGVVMVTYPFVLELVNP